MTKNTTQISKHHRWISIKFKISHLTKWFFFRQMKVIHTLVALACVGVGGAFMWSPIEACLESTPLNLVHMGYFFVGLVMGGVGSLLFNFQEWLSVKVTFHRMCARKIKVSMDMYNKLKKILSSRYILYFRNFEAEIFAYV